MDSNQNNVLQFPGGKKKETEPSAQKPSAPAASKPAQKSQRKGKKSKAVTAGTVIAIILATGAVNRFIFEQKVESLDASSLSNVSRTIASIEPVKWQRDAKWEKDLAESLASAQSRTIASASLGHPATKEEKLRWGILEEKYTIEYVPDVHNIKTIILQDPSATPAYVLDRSKFMSDYGPLFDGRFASSRLKSVEVSSDKTIESYTIYDKDKRPKSEARFELDIHKRLLSLKVEPVEI